MLRLNPEPMIISKDNHSIKKLIGLKKENRRKKAGLILVEGIKEVEMARAGGLPVLQVYYVPGMPCKQVMQKFKDADVYEVSKDVFAQLSFRQNPDWIMAVASQPDQGLDKIDIGVCPLLLVLDSLEKPGNLGAIVRTAEAAGVDAVIVCDKGVDIYNHNVIRASRGAVFSIPVLRSESKQTKEWLENKGLRIVVATPHTQNIYTDQDLSEPAAIIVGSEDKGVGKIWLGRGVREVKIPLVGKIDSLNVSVSAGILVYEAIRQRNRKEFAKL